MSFRDIKGQDRAVLFLKRALETRRIAHAYIFLGPGGVGKKLTALNFAKALNCHGPSITIPCGICISCKKIDSSNHPDVFLLRPEKKGASFGIDRVREMIRSIVLKPYEAKKKVYIIDGADAMTQEASNALLKTLEEPAADSVLILITQNIAALLPTLISRSQLVKFFPLKTDEVKELLMKEYKVDEGRAHILSHLSSGRPGEAAKYNNEAFFEKRSRLIKATVDKKLFDFDQERPPLKDDIRLYLDIMLTWFRDIIVAKAGAGQALALINIDREEAVLNEAKRMEFDRLEEIINRIILTNSYLEQNANPKLAMAVLEASCVVARGPANAG